MPETYDSIITRHADKGVWKINEEELKGQVEPAQADLIMTVLHEEFSKMEETPLKMEGLIRSVHLGDNLYDNSEPRQVILSINSGKDRAKLTNSISTARIAQRESIAEKTDMGKKRIDMLQIDEDEFINLLRDADDSTWEKYGKMIKDEGISEAEAIMRWLADMNAESSQIEPDMHPHEASERYRTLIRLLRDKIKIGKDEEDNEIPMMLFAVGHSGSLGQVRHEDLGQITNADDTPQFCEMYKFDKDGQLQSTEHVNL